MRVLAGNGSAVIEDCQDFHRMQEVMSSLMANTVRENTDIQGFGGRWDSYSTLDATTYTVDVLPSIPYGTAKTVNFKPFCGLFNWSKYIPLKFCPITLEFELADTLDAIASPGATPTTALNTTSLWEINNCCIKCDICTLDNALNNSYVEHLSAGKALPIEYSTYISQQSATSGTNFAVQVVRAVSRLQWAFITFYSNSLTGLLAKPALNFYHPMKTAGGTYSATYELEFQIQLGSKINSWISMHFTCRMLLPSEKNIKPTRTQAAQSQHKIQKLFSR